MPTQTRNVQKMRIQTMENEKELLSKESRAKALEGHKTRSPSVKNAFFSFISQLSKSNLVVGILLVLVMYGSSKTIHGHKWEPKTWFQRFEPSCKMFNLIKLIALCTINMVSIISKI
ncbi:hypothetical protein AMTRI_Chr02g216070 [Amborella trichopoda]